MTFHEQRLLIMRSLRVSQTLYPYAYGPPAYETRWQAQSGRSSLCPRSKLSVPTRMLRFSSETPFLPMYTYAGGGDELGGCLGDGVGL